MLSRCRQDGVALAIVVWFLAAMSLLVAGIVSQARVDTRMAQLHAAKAKAVAAGDGAIQLMLANMESGNAESFDTSYRLPTMNFEIGSYPVRVQSVPVLGLIDLNSASKNVFASLFLVHGGQSEGSAQILADNVVRWRSSGSAQRLSGVTFAAIEDLLRVEGVSRTILDGIRDSVSVGGSARKGVDWSRAPPSVLDVLAVSNPGKVSLILDSSGQRFESPGIRTRQGADKVSKGVKGGSYRLDAIVQVGDQLWLRRRWASGGKAVGSQLPWRYTRTEAPRVFHKLVTNRNNLDL